jgi:hypothetical protein
MPDGSARRFDLPPVHGHLHRSEHDLGDQPDRDRAMIIGIMVTIRATLVPGTVWPNRQWRRR